WAGERGVHAGLRQGAGRVRRRAAHPDFPRLGPAQVPGRGGLPGPVAPVAAGREAEHGDRHGPVGSKREAMNVISMSLYGREPKYVTGALENAALAPRIYPGWE